MKYLQYKKQNELNRKVPDELFGLGILGRLQNRKFLLSEMKKVGRDPDEKTAKNDLLW